MFKRGKDEFFFHREDMLGTTSLRLVKDYLIEEIIHINLIGQKTFYYLEQMAKDIANKMKSMGLIWDAIREQFEILIKKLLIKTAVEMGVSRTFLTDLVIQSEKISESLEEKKALINIIDGSDRFEDLNVVTISDKEVVEDEAERAKLDEILGQVQGRGFCPNCGKIILEQDLSNRCSKCEQEFKPKDLLKSIDAANEASMRFKQEKLQEAQLTICPNPDCEAMIRVDWDECPVCSTHIKK